MPFGASRHVVSIIRFSHHDGCRLVHPDTWYQLFGSPIMTDAVWCIPTRGINYSVLPSCRMPFSASRHVVSIIRFSHHVRCRLVHPDTWYQLNAIRHQDGCRLVHPSKWDISSMPYAIMTDADWCIPPVGHWKISGCLRDGCQLVHPVRRFILHNIQFTFTTDSV